jgi:hypothetical protein
VFFNRKKGRKMENQSNLVDGKLYFCEDGELKELPKSDTPKIALPKEVFERLKEVRKAVEKNIGFRPELSVCAAGLLLEGMKGVDFVQVIKEYAQRAYR